MSLSAKKKVKEKLEKARAKKFKIANVFTGILLILLFWIVIPLFFFSKLVSSEKASKNYEMWQHTKYIEIIPSYILAISRLLRGKDTT